jgi:hypothetical protein
VGPGHVSGEPTVASVDLFPQWDRCRGVMLMGAMN